MPFLSKLFSSEPPEQRELSQRKATVEDLNIEVAQRELDLATLRGELQAFRAEYYRRLGVLYQDKDRLSALVARLLASLEPENADRQAQALDAQAQAQATEQEVEQEFNNGNSEPAPFAPSAELKAAYRQAAKIMHPDRANSDEDRAYRTEMMAKVNVAYEAMNLDALVQQVNEFKAQADIGGGVGRELVLIIRQEAALRERLTHIDSEIEALRNNEISHLKSQVAQARDDGRDLLDEMAARVAAEIGALQKQSEELKAMVADSAQQREVDVVNGQTPTPQDNNRNGSSAAHIHRTDRGEFVRSKSELVVANVFHALGLDYHYERTIIGRNTGGKRLPDFVFISAQDELIVWEHLGMLSVPEYLERWRVKQKWYEDNGFIPGVNLFTSRDQADGSLDSQVVRKQALLLKTLL